MVLESGRLPEKRQINGIPSRVVHPFAPHSAWGDYAGVFEGHYMIHHHLLGVA